MAQYFPELTANMQSLGSKGIPAVADLAAALQITRKGAGDASGAATNLTNLLSKINAEDTVNNFKAFGIDVPAAMKKAAREGRSPIEEIVRLTQMATGGDQSQLSKLFGDMQVQQALRPLMSAFKEYQSIRSEALSASGTVNTDFAERMEDGAEKVKQLRIEASDLSITLGSQLLPLIASGAGYLSKAAKAAAGFAKEHPDLIRAAAVATGILAALFLVLGAGGLVLAAIVAPVAVLGAAATALGIGLLPLIGIAAAVVAGIAALAAISYWLYENWGNWPKIMEGIFAAIKLAFTSFTPLGWLMNAFRPALAYLRSINLTDIGRWIIKGLINGIKIMIPGLGGTLSMVGNMIPDRIRKLLGIHSPSRVFAEIGGHVMGGLDQGLAANVPGPIARISDLAEQMTRALAVGASGAAIAAAAPTAAQSAGAAGPPASTQINHYTIKVEVSGDAPLNDIAEAVRRALDQIERERRGRGFGDDGA